MLVIEQAFLSSTNVQCTFTYENQVKLHFCRLVWLAGTLNERFQQLVPGTRLRRIAITNLYANDAGMVVAVRRPFGDILRSASGQAAADAG